MESYVVEELIQRMLAENPALADSLAVRKAADSEFADNPWAIRYWFYEQTLYYDQRVGVYPVGLLADRTTLGALHIE